MAIHVFGCRMRHDIRSPFKGITINRRRKSIIYNERHLMRVSNTGKFFDIQNYQRRIGYCFRQHAFRIGPESFFKFFLGQIRVDHRTLNPHLFHRHGQKVKRTAVNGRGHDYMISALTDIKNSVVISRLSGRRKHCRRAALQFANFCRHKIIRRILHPRIKISGFFQIK